jgi:hypothetical protein
MVGIEGIEGMGWRNEGMGEWDGEMAEGEWRNGGRRNGEMAEGDGEMV